MLAHLHRYCTVPLHAGSVGSTTLAGDRGRDATFAGTPISKIGRRGPEGRGHAYLRTIAPIR